MKMEVENSTVEQVRNRLELAKKKKLGLAISTEREQIKLLTDEGSLKKIDGSNDSQEYESDEEGDDMAKIMGFGSFQ